MILAITYQNQQFTVNTLANDFQAALNEIFQGSNFYRDDTTGIAYGINIFRQSIITSVIDDGNARATEAEYNAAWEALRHVSDLGAQLASLDPSLNYGTDILNFEGWANSGLISQEDYMAYRAMRAALINTDINTYTITSANSRGIIEEGNRLSVVITGVIANWNANHP